MLEYSNKQAITRRFVKVHFEILLINLSFFFFSFYSQVEVLVAQNYLSWVFTRSSRFSRLKAWKNSSSSDSIALASPASRDHLKLLQLFGDDFLNIFLKILILKPQVPLNNLRKLWLRLVYFLMSLELSDWQFSAEWKLLEINRQFSARKRLLELQ